MDSTLSYLRQSHPHSPSSRNKQRFNYANNPGISKTSSPRANKTYLTTNGQSNVQNKVTRSGSNSKIDKVVTPPTTPSKKSHPTTPTKRSFIYSSPIKSPRKNSFSDRFLPLRNAVSSSFDGSAVPVSLIDSPLHSNNSSFTENDEMNGPVRNDNNIEKEKEEVKNDATKAAYSMLLKNELLGNTCESRYDNIPIDSSIVQNYDNSVLGYFSKYPSLQKGINARELSLNLSPIGKSSQRVLVSPRKAPRNISKVPFKVLDAPELQDDFYLNLIDWSQQNVLAVGLSTSVYLWNACTSQVTKLCNLKKDDDSISSVGWIGRGQYLAVGTFNGNVQIWDTQSGKRMRTMTGHTARVGTLSSKGCLLLSGSRDRSILYHDARSPEHWIGKLYGHKQEVCGVRWSPDKNLVASGGNDNKLLVWDINNYGSGPLHAFTEHKAAVKAISWSPHQSGLLASGGGTADRKIRFWNTVTGTAINCIDTGSQVCNISWSNVANEIVSTHGYSQNQIIVWKYPSMTPIVKLTGHTYRVLYLAMSPCGQMVVTGAGDETLRFWNIFDKAASSLDKRSVLTPFSKIR